MKPFLWLGIAAVLTAGCREDTAVEKAATVNPFNYCADTGTVDQPDPATFGDAVPGNVVDGLVATAGISAATPRSVVANGTTWRCMNGKVVACFAGANLPCREKADVSTAPAPATKDYCAANPDAAFVPATVAGRATIYEWRCDAGTPLRADTVYTPDDAGYISEIWYTLSPPPSP